MCVSNHQLEKSFTNMIYVVESIRSLTIRVAGRAASHFLSIEVGDHSDSTVGPALQWQWGSFGKGRLSALTVQGDDFFNSAGTITHIGPPHQHFKRLFILLAVAWFPALLSRPTLLRESRSLFSKFLAVFKSLVLHNLTDTALHG